MVMSELLTALQAMGVETTEAKIRYAIATGKIPRPQMNGSLTFIFTDALVAEIATHFASPRKRVNAAKPRPLALAGVSAG